MKSSRVNHVERSDTDFLLQQQSKRFVIRFHRDAEKILRKFRMKTNEFDQMTNHQSDQRHSQ